MKLVIDRYKWRFGGHSKLEKFGDTQLLNKEGYMCCLGFFSLECGYSEEDILGKPTPSTLDNLDKYPKWFVETLNRSGLIAINDKRQLHSFEREKLLKEEFAKNGVEVEFVGEYPK